MINNLSPVRFIYAYSVYKKGDIASFPQKNCEKLIALGVAVAYVPNAPIGLAKIRNVASKMIRKDR